jgi:CubicO group peptidase (beta-lactamase class C family)
VFLDSFGYADVEHQVPVTDSTVFQIASCTKALVGVAAMQLVEAGELDLGAPVSRYLGNLPAAWRTITVGQIVTHTSGLRDVVDNFALRLIVEGDAEASWKKLQTLPLESAPGDRFNYIQTNYVLLGKLIDEVAREPFVDFICKGQLDVARMRHTVYGDDHDVIARSARTYTPYALRDGKLVRTSTLYKVYVEFPPMLRTCGGLNTTAEDLAHWVIALQRGDLLKHKSSLETLWTASRLNDGKPGAWGIGGWVFAREKHPVFFSVGAAKSAFAIYPEDDLAVVALTNLSADLWLPFVDGIAAYYI